MSYSKEIEVKIIRTKHKIVFQNGTRVVDLIGHLQYAPQDAEVDECYEKDNEYILMLYHEKVDKR